MIPGNLTDTEYGRLPWIEAQSIFAQGGAELKTDQIVACGWHGTLVNPERGAFAIVNKDGLLADYVGERVKVTYDSGVEAPIRAVYVYVLDVDAIEEDISLTRRAFLSIAPLATETLSVHVEVMV